MLSLRLNRREFAALLGAPFSPIAARAQHTTAPVVGFLHSASPIPYTSASDAFSQGLKEIGFVAGQNVSIEYRWAEGQRDRLPALAADLVRRQVGVIVAPGNDITALAAKAATATIPIVFVNGSDPVRIGLVASINRPGGNITGVSLFSGTVEPKRLELLHALVPSVRIIAVLTDQLVAEGEPRSKALADVATSLGVQLAFLKVSNEGELETAFASIAERRIGALFVSGSALFLDRRDELVHLALRQKIPAIYAWRDMVVAGGLMSYGASVQESYYQAGVYAGRILKRERPADLPVLQPTKFNLVINLNTAKALDIPIPDRLLALADEVVE
jgi:putative ABC transport system substrate-binding protein